MAAARATTALLLALALAPTTWATDARAGADLPENRQPSGRPVQGGGGFNEVFGAHWDRLVSMWSVRATGSQHGFLPAHLGNVTMLEATSGCIACCGTGDCSRAYMDSTVGQCCFANPPTCCPSSATCSVNGCSIAGGQGGGYPYIPQGTSHDSLKSTVIVIIVIIFCLCCIGHIAMQMCSPGNMVGGALYQIPCIGPCLASCFRSQYYGGGYGTPYGGAPGYGGYPGGYAVPATPAYAAPAYGPAYGGGYPAPGYPGGGYTGTEMAMAGGGGFLGGLGLGYLLGENA